MSKDFLGFILGFPWDEMSRDKPGRDVPLSLCPGTKKISCPGVPLSRDNGRSKCPGTKSSVSRRPWTKWIKNFQKIDQISCFLVLLGKWFCPGTSRDRGVCPGTFAPALVPGQRDTGTRKFFCPGTKGQRDVPSRGNPNTNWNLTSNQLLPHCRLDRLTKLVRNVYSRGRLVVGGSLTANQSHVDNFCNLLKAWTATNK